MTPIDVLKMAIEASLAAETSDGIHQIWYPDNLCHFANIVRAKERENWPAEMKAMENQVNILTDALGEAVWIYSEAVEKEREACAKLVENYMKETAIMEALGCLASVAYDIRTRGEKK